MKPIYVLGLGKYKKMGKEILSLLKNNLCTNSWPVPNSVVEELAMQRKVFPDGEVYNKLDTDVRNADVVIVSGTIDDSHTLELYDVCCAIAKYGANSLHIVIPYFSYSTMEREVLAGEVVKAKTRARLLSVIPATTNGNHVYFLDLHAEGIPFYLEGNLKSKHIYAESITIQAISDAAKGKEYVVASTDAGRAKWVESLAKKLNVPASFCLKHRNPDGTLSLSAVSAHVEGKHVVIYDDMIRTGGSLLQAAKAYLAAGATSVDAVTTHAILPGKSLAKILKSKAINKIHATDSHPRAVMLARSNKNLHIHSVAQTIVDGLLKTMQIQKD